MVRGVTRCHVCGVAGILPVVMSGCAWIFGFFAAVSPMESVSAAANVFVGMTNAPLLIKQALPEASMPPPHDRTNCGVAFAQKHYA